MPRTPPSGFDSAVILPNLKRSATLLGFAHLPNARTRGRTNAETSCRPTEGASALSSSLTVPQVPFSTNCASSSCCNAESGGGAAAMLKVIVSSSLDFLIVTLSLSFILSLLHNHCVISFQWSPSSPVFGNVDPILVGLVASLDWIFIFLYFTYLFVEIIEIMFPSFSRSSSRSISFIS